MLMEFRVFRILRMTWLGCMIIFLLLAELSYCRKALAILTMVMA